MDRFGVSSLFRPGPPPETLGELVSFVQQELDDWRANSTESIDESGVVHASDLCNWRGGTVVLENSIRIEDSDLPTSTTHSRPEIDSISIAAKRFRTNSDQHTQETVRGNRNTAIPALLSGGNRSTSAKSKSKVINQRLSAAQISNRRRASSTPFSFS